MKRVALITGGSRGIGLGIATQLARNGFDIAINGVRPFEEVATVIDELKKIGNEVIYCQGDISSAAGRQKIINEIETTFGRLHILVNDAGVAPKERKDILEATEESFIHLMT